VGLGPDRRGRRVLGVAASPVGDRPLAQPLQEDVRIEAAAVEAAVDDDPLLLGLGVEILGELAGRTGVRVGQVQVADPAARGLRHDPAVVLHPVEVAQGPLRGQRLDGVLAGAGSFRLVVDQDLHLFAGQVLEVRVHLAVAVDLHAVDGQEVVAFAHADAHRGQGRLHIVGPVGHAADLPETVALARRVQLVVGAEQAHRDLLGLALLGAAAHVGVRRVELADELAEDVHHVLAAGGPLQERQVARVHGGPVEPVHARLVEEVALHPPRLVEDLPPFGPRVDPDLQVGQRQLVGFRFRRFELQRGQLRPLPANDPLAVTGEPEVVRTLEQAALLAGVESEGAQIPGAGPAILEPVEVAVGGVEVVQRALAGGQLAVVTPRQRHGLDPFGQAVEIDDNAGRSRGGGRRCSRRRGRRAGLLVAREREARRAIAAEGQAIDPGRLLVDHLPLEVAKGGIEPAVGDEEQVFPVAGEHRAEIVEQAVADAAGAVLLQ